MTDGDKDVLMERVNRIIATAWFCNEYSEDKKELSKEMRGLLRWLSLDKYIIAENHTGILYFAKTVSFTRSLSFCLSSL